MMCSCALIDPNKIVSKATVSIKRFAVITHVYTVTIGSKYTKLYRGITYMAWQYEGKLDYVATPSTAVAYYVSVVMVVRLATNIMLLP